MAKLPLDAINDGRCQIRKATIEVAATVNCRSSNLSSENVLSESNGVRVRSENYFAQNASIAVGLQQKDEQMM